MSVQTVSIFNGTVDPSVENSSSIFTSGIGFYLIAPTAGVEYEVDIFLQVQLTSTVTRMVRLDPLNISTTERLTVIPQQLRDLGLPMYLAIFPSEAFNLEVLLLQPLCQLSGICTRLDAMDQKLDDLAASMGGLANDNGQLEIILNLILTALGVAPPALPPTIAQQQFFFLQ